MIRIPAVPVILPFLKPSPPGKYTKKLKLFSVMKPQNMRSIPGLYWKIIKKYEPGKYGILEPKEGCEKISPKAIHLALIPCLSCSMKGERLGYGGGYYDRYLQQITGTQAVLCRTALMCDEIPMEAHDRTIDFVICEAGVLNTKNNA